MPTAVLAIDDDTSVDPQGGLQRHRVMRFLSNSTANLIGLGREHACARIAALLVVERARKQVGVVHRRPQPAHVLSQGAGPEKRNGWPNGSQRILQTRWAMWRKGPSGSLPPATISSASTSATPAPKTLEFLKRAMAACLFIDEAANYLYRPEK